MHIENNVIEISDEHPQQLDQMITSQEYYLPSNKTCHYVIFPMNCNVLLERKKNVFNQLCHSKDGNTFFLQINLEFKDDNVTFLISCKSTQEVMDQSQTIYLFLSKNYKLTSYLYCQQLKKSKDIKIHVREQTIKISLNNKHLQHQICIRNEISIEIVPKYNSRDEVGFCGIINNSATCYMNSVFQILFNLGVFQQLIYQIQLEEQFKFPCTLQNLFYNLRTSKVSVSTQEIIKSFNWDVDQQAIQQDVQEFIMELLQAIVTKSPQIDKQILSLFQGTLENHIKNEAFDMVNSEQFMDIQLNITENIKQSLQLFVSNELLDGDNAYNHEELGHQSAIKFHKFKQLPPILLINLKRYTYDNGGFGKIHDKFEFYDIVDFKEYTTQNEEQLYQLYAVLVHKGEAINHGHYYCFIKPFYGSQQWFKFDDKVVSRATQTEVFTNNFGGEYEDVEYNQDLEQIITNTKPNPETAYLLIYIKKDQPHILDIPNNYPEWILKREQIINQEQYQKKNYMISNIFSLAQLNENIQEINTGLIYSKKAQNASIDLNELEDFFDKYTIQIQIPKIILVGQIIEHLADSLQIEKQSLILYMYKVSNSKPNYESFILLHNSKLLSSYLIGKIHKWALFITSQDPIIQDKINENLGIEQIKIQQPLIKASNGKNQKIQLIENKYLTFIKVYDGIQTKFQHLIIKNNKDEQIELNYPESIKYYQFDFEMKVESQFLKNQEYQIIYIDQQGDLLNKFEQLKGRKEVILRVTGEQFYSTQIFQKSDTFNDLLQFLAVQEECNPDNIQVKYKDRKGNFIIAPDNLNIDELTSYENVISYKQTIVPVGAMKEQMSVTIENQTYIVQKSISVAEFMEQEHFTGKLLLMTQKKDQKASFVLIDTHIKLQRITSKNYINFVDPIVLGTNAFIVCFIQSVEIILLRQPIVIQIANDTTAAELVKTIMVFLEQNPLKYKSQQLMFDEEGIISTDEDKVKRLELQLRLKINGQEISSDSQITLSSLELNDNQGIAVLTFLTIRDNKTDKLRDKGVQIL